MEYLSNSLHTVVVIAILMAVGYVFAKYIKLNDAQYSMMAKLIVMIAIPGMIFTSVVENVEISNFAEDIPLFLLLIVCYAILIALSIYCARLIKLPKRHGGLFVVMCTMPNTLMLGSIISVGIFGQEAMRFVMHSYIVNTFVFWILGTHFIRQAAGKEDRLFSLATLKKIFTTPALIAFFLGMLVLVTGLKLPAVVSDAIGKLGSMSTPVGMIYIGMTLYRAGIMTKIERGMLPMLGIRFILSPLIMLLLMLPFSVGVMPKTVLALQMAMPVMTQSSVVAALEGADAGYIAKGTVITTVLCLAVTPLITVVAPLF